MAYPPDSIAITAVKNIKPPCPKYLDQSVGHFLRISRLTPEQIQKNSNKKFAFFAGGCGFVVFDSILVILFFAK